MIALPSSLSHIKSIELSTLSIRPWDKRRPAILSAFNYTLAFIVIADATDRLQDLIKFLVVFTVNLAIRQLKSTMPCLKFEILGRRMQLVLVD